MREESQEIEEALTDYTAASTPEHLDHLKMEIGDLLFNICCLANSQ